MARAAAVGPPAGRTPTQAPTRTAFERHVVLHGWAARSRWGYDPVLECYWAELWAEGRSRPDVVVGPEHLLSTPGALARAVAHAARVAETEAYLALTG